MFSIAQLFFYIRITFIFCFVRLNTTYGILNANLLGKFNPFENEEADTDIISEFYSLILGLLLSL